MNDPFDTRLKKSLKERWPESEADPRKKAAILNRLNASQENTITMKTRFLTPMRTLAGLAVLALVALVLSLTLDTMSPAPAAVDTVSYTSTAPGPTSEWRATEEAGTPESPELPAPSENGRPTPSSVAVFPGVAWNFEVPLPPSGEIVTLYRQAFLPPISEAAAAETAARFGVAGPVTSHPGEGSETIYQAADDVHTMIFLGFEGQFTYFQDTENSSGEPLAFEVRKQIAEDFLNVLGLLSFPYRAEPDLSDPNGVRFVQLLDGLPLVYGLGMNPGLLEWVTVIVSPAGSVTQLYHSLHDFQPVKEVNVLTAEEAWSRFAGPLGDLRSQYAILAPPLTWNQPDIPLEETLTGWLTMENGVPTLYADDGRDLNVSGLPEDLPPDMVVRIRGVVNDGVVRWGEIFIGGPSNSYGSSWSCGGGGGGGGGPFEGANFGGGQFAQLNLGESALEPTQSPFVSPVQPGERLENIEGIINLYQHIYPNGAQQLEVNFWFAGEDGQEGWTGLLENYELEGLTGLQNLPVIISGSVDRLNERGLPVVNVERLEPAYPGMQISAFQGQQVAVAIDGKDVLLLETASGEQYVVDHSILLGAEAVRVGLPGDVVVHEGFVIPGKTFGGYPVLNDLAGGVADSADLSAYQIQSTRIGIWDESGGAVNLAASLSGEASIENAELVYAAVSLGRCSPDFLEYPGSDQWLLVQPVWRFLGTFNDGRTFEILVQALPEEYLR